MLMSMKLVEVPPEGFEAIELLVDEAQTDRVVLTRDGRPVAMMVGLGDVPWSEPARKRTDQSARRDDRDQTDEGDETEDVALDMAPRTVASATDGAVRRAIHERRLLRLTTNGESRLVEPYDYGVRNGATELLCFQIAGASKSGRLPGWRRLQVAGAERAEVLPRPFWPRRAADRPPGGPFDEILATVSEAPLP